MAQECEVRAPEDFVLAHVPKPTLRERYQQFMFKDHVKSHPELRFCPGPNCQVIFNISHQKAVLLFITIIVTLAAPNELLTL
jgi:ariadne-2